MSLGRIPSGMDQERLPVLNPVVVAQEDGYGNGSRFTRRADELEPGFTGGEVGFAGVDPLVGQDAILPSGFAAPGTGTT